MSENSDGAETVQLKAEVPKHLKEQVKSELGYGGIKQVVVDKLKEVVRGETVAAVEETNEERLESVLVGYDAMMTRAEQYDGVMDELATELRRDAIASVHAVARENRDRLAEAQGEIEESVNTEYESLLSELEQSLENGLRVWESHGTVEKAARLKGKSATEVIDELKERKPDKEDWQFEEKTPYTSPTSPTFSSTSGD